MASSFENSFEKSKMIIDEEWRKEACERERAVMEAKLEGLDSSMKDVDYEQEEDDQIAEVALETVGDASRLGLAVMPKEVRKWLEKTKIEVVPKMLERVNAELEEIMDNPSSMGDIDAENQDVEREIVLSELVKRRDRVESLKLGIARMAVSRKILLMLDPSVIEGFEAFLITLERYDQMLKQKGLVRSAVLDLLESRRWFIDSGSAESDWTEMLLEPKEGSSTESAETRRPPIKVIDEYITSGEPASWVEGFAHRNSEFWLELLERIGDFKRMDEKISEKALQWAEDMARDKMDEILKERLSKRKRGLPS